ncbi:MAG: phage terminase large subunit [Candidatus Kapaibacterium sp.]|nr:phage terminase large subunit [Ignavibacteriota bacterium]
MNLFHLIKLLTPQSIANSLFSDNWLSPVHIDFIEHKLLQLYSGKKNKLIINMPPRHGKSQLVTKIFPLWWLLNRPNDRIILSAYNSTLAEYFGREILDMFKSISRTYGLDLNNAQKSKSEFVTNKNGSISAVGVGGSLTGKGANLIIVDDPIKNDSEANSPDARDKIYEWFNATLLTRLEPNGAIILVMTRWHEDDLAGRLLKQKKWDRIVLPAVAEKNDTLGRKVGEPLWGDRYSKSSLLDIKDSIGSYWFSSLYQQSPAPSGGGIFKRSDFKYFELFSGHIKSRDFTIELSDLDTFFACDLAISTNEKADFTVISVFVKDKDKNLIILDLVREKILPSRHIELIRELYEKYKPMQIGIETVQYQASLFHNLSNLGLPVTKLVPKKDKVSRALPLAAKIEAGKVYFNKSINCLAEIENELLNFPNAKHDDIVDTLSYATEMILMISETQPVGYHRKRENLLRGFMG